jgi:hypothetical protein
MPDAICQDCREPKKIWSRNRCVTCYRAHLKALKAEGSYAPLIRKKPRLSPFDKVMSRVDKRPAGGCWLYTGALMADGYARVKDAGSDLALLVHRVTYEELTGPIPDGLVLDHLCRVRNCVNPAHLEPVSGRENLVRGVAARLGERTHCREGHEMTPANTALNRRKLKSGGVSYSKTCRECKNAYYRAKNAERKKP